MRDCQCSQSAAPSSSSVSRHKVVESLQLPMSSDDNEVICYRFHFRELAYTVSPNPNPTRHSNTALVQTFFSSCHFPPGKPHFVVVYSDSLFENPSAGPEVGVDGKSGLRSRPSEAPRSKKTTVIFLFLWSKHKYIY